MSISFYDYCIKYNMQHLLEEWDYERNSKTPKEVTSKNAYVAWWKCKKGHSWKTRVHTRSNGSNCPRCGTLQVHINQNICKDYEEIYKFWTQHRIYPLGLKMQDNRLYLDFEAIKIRGPVRYNIDTLIGPEDTSILSLEIYKYLKVISHFRYYKTKYYRDLLFTDTISALEKLRNYM